MDDSTVITLAVIAAVVLVAFARRYQRLKVKVEKGDLKVSIDGSNPSESPSAAPPSAESVAHIETQNVVHGNQTNVQGGQDNAGRDINKVGSDQLNAGRDIIINRGPASPERSILHQIHEPTVDFVGREEEIKKLMAVFDGAGQGAMISGVRGMGGVGKTELAFVLARKLKDHYPDGQIYFNLRGASDDESSNPATAAEILSHVIHSFHPDAKLPEDADALRGIYHSALEGKRVLLLMDNALNAAQLAPMTPPPPGCALMVTSRYRFHLGGMEPLDLNTMPRGEACKLLVKICGRIGDNADALAERCGDLPLALSLAASALLERPTLAVAKYIEDLGAERGRLEKLDEYKGATDEERGIQASLSISDKLLDEGLRRFWRALGVFPGDFDSEAACAVGPLPEGQDAEKALGDLHAASMVEWDGATGRFRLHDLARDYARSRLSDEERAEIEQLHAEHFKAVLRKTSELYLQGGDSILRALVLFDLERGNIEAGHTWAADRRASDMAAARLTSDYPNAGIFCISLRLQFREQIVWLEAAVEAARTLENRRAEGGHLGNLGSAYAALGEPREAIVFYEKRLVIAHEIGDRRGEGTALGNLGCAYADLGEMRKAIGFYEQHLEIARQVGDRVSEGNNLGNLGTAYTDLGRTRLAIGFHEQQLEIVQAIGDRRGEGAALGSLGIAYARIGEPSKAIEYNEQGLVILREIGDRLGEANVSHNLAGTLSEVGRGGDAIAHAEKAVASLEQIESPNAVVARARLKELLEQADESYEKKEN